MTWFYVIGGIFLFFVICGIINGIRKRRAIKAEFLYQLALAKKNGTNEIHWDPKNVRY